MKISKKSTVISIGTIYLDVHCLEFPIGEGLLKNKEIRGSKYHLSVGGSAFNFAKLCADLGLEATFIGSRGADAMGELIEQEVIKSGVKPFINIDKNAQSNVAVHYISPNGESIMTSCGSANQSLSGENVHAALQELHATAQFLYLGGCFKLSHLLPSYIKLAAMAQEKGMQVVVDHGRVNNSVSVTDLETVRKLLVHTDYYLPSKDEFLGTWQAKNISQALHAAREYTNATIIVKDSENGAFASTRSDYIHVPAYRVSVVNTVGAGDSFNAGFILGLSKNYDLVKSVQLAHAVAAARISSLGEISLDTVNLFQQRE